MPAHSFMLADIACSLLAVCLFPLFALVPGFALAWLTDLFDFRRRTSVFQIALSIPLSIATCPILTYLGARAGSMKVVWAIYASSWVYALIVVVRHRIALPRGTRAAALALSAWTAIAIFSLVDLQSGHRAWFPAAAFDYSVRAQFIHSIGTTGIPPANPFYLPGHPVPLRYHYFWLLTCALVDAVGGSIVSARHAWIGGAVWCGFGLMAVVALYLRLFFYRGPDSFRRRVMAGVLLLAVAGLDIIPTAGLWALQATGMRGVLPSGEWWNEQVDSFVYTAIWEAHYLAGLIACLMAFLILWDASRRPAAARWRHTLVGAIALASAAGSSVYLSFVFGIFLAVWMAMSAMGRRWAECAVLAIAGTVGLTLFFPYVLSLRGPALGGPALQVWMRPFYPVDALFNGQGIGNGPVRAIANLLALPLNYFLELGFFYSAAVLWWKRRRVSGQPLSSAERATIMMIAVSALICTFLRSSVIGNNDLGWRGFLFAQFGLLLLAVDVVTDWFAIRERRRFLTVLIVLGVLGSAYELGINRFYPLLADHGTVAKLSWLAPGNLNYAMREAGEWTAASTGAGAIVQYNPHVAVQDTSAYLYSARQMIAADNTCLSTFGGDPALCSSLIATLNRIYPLGSAQAATGLDEVCRALPVDVFAAVDTDPAWSDRGSWVWNERPAFANGSVRLFRCPEAGRRRMAGLPW